ncbi:MAG: c-type cytochrome [Acidimicrobiales bacterium]
MKFRHTIALMIFSVLAISACSQEADIPLSTAGSEGRDLARASGCSSCHGKNGQGVTAPTWQGLYGNQVELDSGLTVVATEDYLYRSITEPQAQIRADWTIKMPMNSLSDDQVASIIAYIKDLQ